MATARTPSLNASARPLSMRAILPDRISRAPEVTGAVQQPPWEVSFRHEWPDPVLPVARCALPDGVGRFHGQAHLLSDHLAGRLCGGCGREVRLGCAGRG